jgi:hypothetical protein
MRGKAIGLFVFVYLAIVGARAHAQPDDHDHDQAGSGSGSVAEPEPAPAPEHHDEAAEPAPAPEPEAAHEPAHEAAPEPAHVEPQPEPAAAAEDPLGEEDEGHYAEQPIDQGGEVGVDGDGEPYMEYDQDGDGVMSTDEVADAKEFEEGFKEAGIPNKIDDDALDARPADKQLLPSLSAAMFRKLVQLAKRKVLAKMEAKMAAKTDQKMMQFIWIVVGCSLAGFLLLFAPLVLRKKYPGQDGTLVKYSALAAFTFFVTVNLFGGVLYAMKTAQGKVSATAPNIAVAGGFFDTLDDNAEQYLVMGKELFAPTLEQLTSKSEEQPAVALIANGQKIVKDASVFVQIAKLFKKVDFIFSMLPVILMLVTIVLFVLSIKPTLVEVIKLPAAAAAGKSGAGKDVVAKAVGRVRGELLASVCALGVLFVLSLGSGFIMGRVAKPALTAIIDYFTLGVNYMQFVPGASSNLVFLMLFSVIFFLVLNLLTLILSMSFFLGKTQKIFQARFNGGVPLSSHARFWKWGILAVLIVQLIPLVFVFIAHFGLDKINDHVMEGATAAGEVNWKMAMLAGPLFLVIGYLIVFWAARGVKAIVFLQRYKVTPPKPLAPEVAG